ncbi:MAG: hypothetical protein AAGF98_08525 [Cyanobacteria bacterium P01_H01_bin.153]
MGTAARREGIITPHTGALAPLSKFMALLLRIQSTLREGHSFTESRIQNAESVLGSWSPATSPAPKPSEQAPPFLNAVRLYTPSPHYSIAHLPCYPHTLPLSPNPLND